jgi:hypothetical protein
VNIRKASFVIENWGCYDGEMRKTYKPVLAGWLDILGGIIWLLAEGFIVLVIIGLSVGFGSPRGLNLLRLWAVLIGLAVPGFLSIYGGVCAVRRRRWFTALIGSITAVPAGFGIPALVLVILSKKEFSDLG